MGDAGEVPRRGDGPRRGHPTGLREALHAGRAEPRYRDVLPTTLFRLASVSKTYCAAAVWKALFDDPLGICFRSSACRRRDGRRVGFRCLRDAPDLGCRGFELVHAFAGGSADGGRPGPARSIDSSAHLCGVIALSGAGSGSVFLFNNDGPLTTLHAFTGGADGSSPWTGPTLAG